MQPQKKDKQKVLGEVFDDARLKQMLAELKTDGERSDFAILERAYRGMKAENFATFVSIFKQAGHDPHATDSDGRSLRDHIAKHRSSADYLEAL